MNIGPENDGALVIREIPDLLLQLLSEIPELGAPYDPRAQARFFPDPADDPKLVEDWKSLIQPELDELFRTARETVEADLRRAKSDGGGILKIPRNHMDAWLSALNQARLAIAERFGFDENDMSAEPRPDPADPRAMALFRVSFYGFLQECIVRTIE